MQQKIIVWAAMCLCILPAHLAFADAKSSAKQGIMAAYNRYVADEDKDGVDGMLRIKSHGYTSIDTDGKVIQRGDAAEHQHYAMITRRPNRWHEKFHIMSLDLRGNQATVTVKCHSDGVIRNRTGQMVTLHIDETDRDFWVRTGSGWQWKRSRTLTATRE